MRATDLDDLLAVVEAVRRDEHSDLPAELVRQIVLLEERFGEDEESALRALREQIEQFVEGGAS